MAFRNHVLMPSVKYCLFYAVNLAQLVDCTLSACDAGLFARWWLGAGDECTEGLLAHGGGLGLACRGRRDLDHTRARVGSVSEEGKDVSWLQYVRVRLG